MSTKLSANAINGIESVQVGQAIVVGEDESGNKILEYGNVSSSQIQSDWNQNNSSAVDYIKNKPTISLLRNIYTVKGYYSFTQGASKTRENINGVVISDTMEMLTIVNNQYDLIILKINWIDDDDNYFEDTYIRNTREECPHPTKYEFVNSYSETVIVSGVTTIQHHINKVYIDDGDIWHYEHICISNNYDDLINKPSLATVATSGSYNDLINKPVSTDNVFVVKCIRGLHQPYDNVTFDKTFAEIKAAAESYKLVMLVCYTTYDGVTYNALENIYYCYDCNNHSSGHGAFISFICSTYYNVESLSMDLRVQQFLAIYRIYADEYIDFYSMSGNVANPFITNKIILGTVNNHLIGNVYSTGSTLAAFSEVSRTGSYDDLLNKPDLTVYETTSNKVTEIDSSSTDTEYPTAKAVYDLVESAPVQIQSDWNQIDNTSVDFIKNKPTIPAAQVQADWNQSNVSSIDYIKNKPVIHYELYQGKWDTNGMLNVYKSDGSYMSASEAHGFYKGDIIKYIKIQEDITDFALGISLRTGVNTGVLLTPLHYNNQVVSNIFECTKKGYLCAGDILVLYIPYDASGSPYQISAVNILNVIECNDSSLKTVSLSGNDWNLNYGYQTLSSKSTDSNLTLTLLGTTNNNNLQIIHLIRIDNTNTANITVTLAKGTNINNIRCLSNQIVIPANNSLELSCYITKESISGTDKYVANVTEYNELQLY